jgi:hypothetical protein
MPDRLGVSAPPKPQQEQDRGDERAGAGPAKGHAAATAQATGAVTAAARAA